jgi:thymidylate synthase
MAVREYEQSYYKERKKPMLILNPDKTNFYDMTIEDFTIENYEPMQPNLKLELGI